MLRVITANLNGIRSAAKKGFFEWMLEQQPDVVCVQESKAQFEQLDATVFQPQHYFSYFVNAQKPGYSGVGIYCRKQPNNIIRSYGCNFADSEGRYVQTDFDKLSVISLYMPSGTSGEQRQGVKYQFMETFYQHLEKLQSAQRDVIICGDWNIAHKIIDIKNWRGNQKNSGFLPEERAWMDKVFDQLGWVDAFRVINQEADQYTWWSNRGRAREKNVGWRIDYQVITPSLKDKVLAQKIYTEKRFSDHAPLIMDYDYQLENLQKPA